MVGQLSTTSRSPCWPFGSPSMACTRTGVEPTSPACLLRGRASHGRPADDRGDHDLDRTQRPAPDGGRTVREGGESHHARWALLRGPVDGPSRPSGIRIAGGASPTRATRLTPVSQHPGFKPSRASRQRLGIAASPCADHDPDSPAERALRSPAAPATRPEPLPFDPSAAVPPAMPGQPVNPGGEHVQPVIPPPGPPADPRSSVPPSAHWCQGLAVPIAIPQRPVVEDRENLHPVDGPRGHGGRRRQRPAEDSGSSQRPSKSPCQRTRHFRLRPRTGRFRSGSP